MTAPRTNFVRAGYQNPDATKGLMLSVAILPNTPDETIKSNIKANSKKYPTWVNSLEPLDRPAIMIGGGDSINDHIDDILKLQKKGGIVFAMNGASKWARGHGIEVDYQVILDAKEETSKLVDPSANAWLFASQCHPKTMEAAREPILWHLDIPELDKCLSPERMAQGGYVLIGGESTVGTCGLCVAYTLGHRELHIFGYDSNYRDGKSHGYRQDINKTMPTMGVKWAGKEFQVSIAMKHQAEKFQVYAQALKNAGAEINVYGEGLLQTIYNTPTKNLTEQEKYQLMWQYDSYRAYSPGEQIAEYYLDKCKPEGKIVDFGCGTGRAGIKFSEKDHAVLLVDFTDNCRDDEALNIPFIQWDLSNPLPVNAPNGYCTDVMEHIPTDDVQTVIDNIMNSASKVFFQISTVDDAFGEVIDTHLHLTVKDHSWWLDKFKNYTIEFSEDLQNASLFYITRSD